MARGDGGKAVFEDDRDRADFISRLAKTCESHGWRIHAWVLMGNHFHLLLETPEPNLVVGMKRLLGSFSQAWNRRRKRRGHVFQGRYKSVPVNGEDRDGWYFRIVADYIHLNPSRAGLAGGTRGALADYRWSSLAAYAGKRQPEWLACDRVLGAFELARDGRGRRAYLAWLEARAAAGGSVSLEAMEALRSGWYLGTESFKDRLLAVLKGGRNVRKASRAGPALKEHGESEAERLVTKALQALGLPAAPSQLAALRKSEPRKIKVAWILRKYTTAGNEWISGRLAMGHPSAVSRALAATAKDPKLTAEAEKLV
jgi:REP element-mobilizing transposase RayT